MHLLNLTLGQFLSVFGAVSALTIALYLLDRSRRRQVVATLRFWTASEQPPVVLRRRRIQQPLSLLLQLLSVALLLLAIAELRLGGQAGAPRNHVLILDTSAWMSATAGGRTLMEAAKERALAYLASLPSEDRVMLVRADAMATPASAFEPDRRKLAQAVAKSEPGATALNLEQALGFARRTLARGGERPGEIAFVGTGRIAETDGAARTSGADLRVLAVPDEVPNAGLEKIALRRSASDAGLWEIYVSARNYGKTERTVTLSLGCGPRSGAGVQQLGERRLTLAPGAEKEAEFEFRSRDAGVLRATLLPHDHFPRDDSAEMEIPAQPSLAVTVYSEDPGWLRPVLAADSRVSATFRKPAEYQPGDEANLVILDRFGPALRPRADSIWIDPPAGGSPVPVVSRVSGVPFTGWASGDILGSGVRTRDLRLDSASVFNAAPGDIRVAEVEQGPVMVARPGKPKIAVLGFHPALSAMRYELATPLLFAHLFRWIDPEVFRRWELNAGRVGTVKLTLDTGAPEGSVRVWHESGAPVPFTSRGRSLEFFSGTPGTVRSVAGDREFVYSLTLPQLWESRWQPPKEARLGLPRFLGERASWFEMWYWLALAGGLGLAAEWILFGRAKPTRRAAPVLRMPQENRTRRAAR